MNSLSIGITTFRNRLDDVKQQITEIRNFDKNIPILLAIMANYNEDGYYSNVLNKGKHLKYPSVKLALSFNQEEIIDEQIKPFDIHGAPKSNGYKKWIANHK